MLTLLVAVLAVAAVPSPAPSPSAPSSSAPVQGQLKEIGHVEAHTACSQIVLHANGAIGAALANDSDLALTINHMRTTDLDDPNEIRRRNGISDLETLASRIRLASLSGYRDVKQLRTIVGQTTQPERKAELKAFTDALSGAIARQRLAASHLDSLLAIAQGRRAAADATAIEANVEPISGETSRMPEFAQPNALHAAGGIPAVPTAAPDAELLRLADEFQAQTQAILVDEATAASHTDGATTGC